MPIQRSGSNWRVRHFIFILVLMGLLPAILHAQAGESTLRGTVTDSTGGVIPGVEVEVRNVNTNAVVRTLITDENGNYEVPELPLGTYQVTATMPGFKAAVVDNLLIESSQIRRVNITLEVGEVTEQVTVRGGAAIITTDSAEISDSFDEEAFDATPTTRTYYPQALMVATMTGVDTQQGSWALRFNGQGGGQVSEGMDGVTEDGTVNLINNMLNFTELKVVAVNASAEHSRVANFNMVSKSGTNEYHGRFQWQHHNSAFNARNFFEREKTVTIDNKWQADMSGPIFKDKTFFYASYFYQSIPGGSFNNATVPTLNMRSGNFSELEQQLVNPFTGEEFPNNQIPENLLNQTALMSQDLYIPEPNQGAPGQISNNLFFQHDFPDDLYRADYPMFRIDHRITENNTIYGRWIHRYTPYVLKRSLPGFDWTRLRYHYGTVISDTHVFSPNVVNTFRFGWLWDDVRDGDQVAGQTPIQGHEVVQQLGIQGVNPSGLEGQGFPRMDITGFSPLETVHGGQAQDDHQINFHEGLTWTKGRHVMKFGGDFKRLSHTGGRIPTGAFGWTQFNGQFTGYSYADFLLGLPYWSRRVDPLIPRTEIAKEFGVYFQDSFKMTDRVTLNYGLRWDYFPAASFEDGLQLRWDPASNNIVVPEEAMSQVSPLYPDSIDVVSGEVLPSADKGNFRPRLGLAYRINDRTVIRGGYGSYTEQIGYFDRLQGGGPFQIAETYSTNEIVDGEPLFAFPNPFPGDVGAAAVPSQSASGYPLETDNGSIHQFNLSLERQFGDIGVRTSYIGSRSRGLNFDLGINKPEASDVPFSVDRRPYSQFTSVSYALAAGKHNYDSFQFQIQKRAGTFTFGTHYTLQSSLSNYGNRENPYIYLSGIGTSGLEERDWDGMWNREQYDARHKFVINTTWDIPVGRGQAHLADVPAAVDHIIGGWKMTTIHYFKSGQYFTPGFSGADPSNTNTVGGIPDRVADGNLPTDQRTIDGWFDVNAFQVPEEGRFGDSGLNILEGPGIHVHHINLTKRFDLTERFGLEYSAAISNLFNRPHFQYPRDNITASDPAVITNARDSNQDQEKAGQRLMEMTLRITW